jgi:SAM-dependent methyltransferase
MDDNRLYPSLTHHRFLVLAHRRELLKREVARLEGEGRSQLRILDVGGHQRPYYPLLASLCRQYVSVDLAGREADVLAEGERLPFADASIDLAICTQVLEYTRWPPDIVGEMYRVLRPGGRAFLSVPAVFPVHGHPHDSWRFMAGGLRILLKDFAEVRITAKGGSVASFFRTLNMYIWVFTGRRWSRPFRWVASRTLAHVNNMMGWYLDRWPKSGDQFAANWLPSLRSSRATCH